MTNLATTVVEEFLRSGTPQVRKNALTALSIIYDEETDQIIGETAIVDEDFGVRAQAESEILSRPTPTAINSLVRALTSDKPQYQQRAYAVLGRLRRQKVKIPRARLGWTTWMWLATSVYTSLYPTRDWAFRLRGMKPGFFGTLVGGIPFLIYVWFQLRPLDYRNSIVLALSLVPVLLLGTVISILGMQFITPINIHLRPWIALLVHAVISFIVVFLGLLVIVIAWTVLMGGGIYRSGLLYGSDSYILLFFLLGFALLAPFVRVGTILAFGRIKFVGGRFGNANWLIQIVGGTVLGTLLTGALYILFRADAPDYEHPRLTVIWLGSIAITVGLATAFANIDAEASPS